MLFRILYFILIVFVVLSIPVCLHSGFDFHLFLEYGGVNLLSALCSLVVVVSGGAYAFALSFKKGMFWSSLFGVIFWAVCIAVAIAGAISYSKGLDWFSIKI